MHQEAGVGARSQLLQGKGVQCGLLAKDKDSISFSARSQVLGGALLLAYGELLADKGYGLIEDETGSKKSKIHEEITTKSVDKP